MAGAKHWVQKVADVVERRVGQTKGDQAAIVCASGISPSGPIHLGNLREVMTVHFVAEELRRRGRAVRHIHSWDDFDRLRKAPEGVGPQFAEHIGRPLCDVPDPWGEHESYAARYMTEFEQALARLGVEPQWIRQSAAYRRGDYVPQIQRSMEHRFELFDILARYQTPGRHEKPAEQRRQEYWPFRVYCESCGKDSTKIRGYEESTSTIGYACQSCRHESQFRLTERVPGKLVWKVDWPMRWSVESVDFEPGGEDHSSPGSSYEVGCHIVEEVFGGRAPYYVGYAFVGMGGRSKISSSAGTTATPSAALDVLEPCMIRWLYVRRNANQKFDVAFGKELVRLYDEWDKLLEQAREGRASERNRYVVENCLRTSAGPVECSALPVPFRVLSSAADLTQGNVEQILRIAGAHLESPPAPEKLQAEIEPRLSCAIRWVGNYLPEDERTRIRDRFDPSVGELLSEEHREGLRLLLEHLDDSWSLAGLTTLIYGVPKLLAGLPLDAPPNDALKRSQRSFFAALYLLLCYEETGPRLPTLFLSLGKERIRALLGPAAESRTSPGEDQES